MTQVSGPIRRVIGRVVPKVGMTRTILAVGPLGDAQMSQSIPNTRLTPATHTGRRGNQQDGGTTAGGQK